MDPEIPEHQSQTTVTDPELFQEPYQVQGQSLDHEGFTWLAEYLYQWVSTMAVHWTLMQLVCMWHMHPLVILTCSQG